MIQFDLDGRILQFATKEMSYLDYFKLVQPYLTAEELLAKIPVLGEYGISADDVEAEILPNKKFFQILKVLVENGLTIRAVRHWYDTKYAEPCLDIKWLFSFYLKKGVSPDELARAFSRFLSRDILVDVENVKILLDLGVKPATLVTEVMTKEQVVAHFDLLYSRGADINQIIDTLGVFPNFYGKYSVKNLVELGAEPLRISEYIFYPLQDYDEAEKCLRYLYHSGLSLTEFVSQIVVAKNHNLYIVVQFAQFFVDRYIDVKSVLKHVTGDSKILSRRAMENKLVVLANYSELSSMGLIDEPKKLKKNWRWEFNQICRSIFDEVIDSHGYNFGFLLDDFAFPEEKSPAEFVDTNTTSAGASDSKIPSFLLHEVQKTKVPEMASSVER